VCAKQVRLTKIEQLREINPAWPGYDYITEAEIQLERQASGSHFSSHPRPDTLILFLQRNWFALYARGIKAHAIIWHFQRQALLDDVDQVFEGVGRAAQHINVNEQLKT
jgi:hypothetical protein